ncbi:MAG: hypothetical protein ACRDI2_16905 [Chloroflexota bacterium]
MSTRPQAKPQAKNTRAEAMDDETRALAASPELRKLLKAGRRGPFSSLEESNRRAGITEEEWAAANAELDRLEREDEAAEDECGGALSNGQPPKERAAGKALSH